MEILHVDAAILVVDKPAGLPVQPDGWEPDAPYLARMLEQEYGRIWVVHRLDKVTSGTLAFARTAEAHRLLSIQFEKHEAHKLYQAIINGAPAWTERTANQSLRGNVGHKHRTIVDPRKGKISSTEFTVLERFAEHALVQAQPLTGRTHQVRAHAAALRCPLLGDSLYGAPPTDLIARPALHALSLTFAHPMTGEQVTYSAPVPIDFTSALDRLRRGGHPRGAQERRGG